MGSMDGTFYTVPKRTYGAKPKTQFTLTREACWECSLRLNHTKRAGYSYLLFRGYDGFDHKVHIQCWQRLMDERHQIYEAEAEIGNYTRDSHD